MDADEIKLMCLQIQKKLSMPDNICCVRNAKFYVLNYSLDLIQKTLVDDIKFYEEKELYEIKKYLPEKGSVIIDIDANIGNHSVFFVQYCNFEKIYAFERWILLLKY